MARSCVCKTCGVKVRPRAKDMSLGAAVRLHYWRAHPEVMTRTRARRGGRPPARRTRP